MIKVARFRRMKRMRYTTAIYDCDDFDDRLTGVERELNWWSWGLVVEKFVSGEIVGLIVCFYVSMSTILMIS
jgi:hypothetical protein